MLKIRFHKQFRKDYKRVIKQPGHTPERFQKVLDCLVSEQLLPANEIIETKKDYLSIVPFCILHCSNS